MSGGSRELILASVRAALGDGAGVAAPIPREYRRSGALEPAEMIDLLCERIGDYRAEVARVAEGELGEAITAAFASAGAARVCVPTGLPAAWLGEGGPEFVADAPLTLAQLDQLDGVLTGATLAIAETGTIVLTAGPAEGRRAPTLVPDLHVCVVAEEQVVETVPEAMSRLAELATAGRRPLTFISGPSATSDIELSRVEGVHGPRNLVVLVVHKEL